MENRDGEIRHYLEQLGGPNGESAWHALVETGPVAIPAVGAALSTAKDPVVRIALVRILAEYRVPDAIPLIAFQLQDPLPAVWQAALDALVTIGPGQAASALADARLVAPEDRRRWIDEALSQIEADTPAAG